MKNTENSKKKSRISLQESISMASGATRDQSDASSSKESDDDNVVVSRKAGQKSVLGYHHKSVSQETTKPLAKKIKLDLSLGLKDEISSSEFVDNLKLCWESNKATSNSFCQLISEPYKAGIVRNLVNNAEALKEVLQEINGMKFNRRNMDLYELFMSDDLKGSDAPCLRTLYKFLNTEVIDWVRKITGLELSTTSAACSLYTCTDHLLVHDDRKDDRLVAYILYLMDPPDNVWKSEMGGALEMFSSSDGQPTKTVREILPQHNQFVFFQVTEKSYHQVAEVLTLDYGRISINGWFHSPSEACCAKIASKISAVPNYLSPKSVECNLEQWISSDYLTLDVQKEIQAHIEETSEISLESFMLSNKFNCTSEALRGNTIQWEWVGPVNLRHYEKAREESLSCELKEFIDLFKSESMFAFLKSLTELDLVSETANQKPTMQFELQRWTPGCYTLLSEFPPGSGSELDLIFYFNVDEKLSLVGGQTIYLGTEEEVENALVTLTPKNNCLNLIFRDSSRFVKYVSRKSTLSMFYTLMCSYKE